eukprot:XP_025015723.1 serine carboxypeptidase-like 18 [Ricinus communis]
MEKQSVLGTFASLIFLHSFLVLLFSQIAASKTVVTTLPGFDGELPFYLETGYIGVGESNESQLFYYFVESQRSPAVDPLMLWLTGGPGCSVLSAFFYESGPVTFDYSNYNGSLPSLHLNPFAWTQGINILYVDAPIGTGFSYSTTQENYYVDDIKSAAQTYEFLRKWLLDHPQFLQNQLFIGGDSYSGIPLPIIVSHVLDGNELGLTPMMNLKGYILGNPKTDDFIDENSLFPFAHRLTLISDELYEDAKEACGGDYVNINASNTECVTYINTYEEMVLQINTMQILEPYCQVSKPRGERLIEAKGRRSLDEDLENISISKLNSALWCRLGDYSYNLSSNCAEKIHCIQAVYFILFFCSGDHDFSVPHIGTQNWIHLLNLTTNEYWRPWFVDGQVAGYTEKFISGDYTLIFATVKGAGHVAPEYKPTQCYAMIDRFFGYFPL